MNQFLDNKVATIFTCDNPTAEDKSKSVSSEESERLEKDENVKIKADLQSKIPDANEQDIEELIELFKGYF